MRKLLSCTIVVFACLGARSEDAVLTAPVVKNAMFFNSQLGVCIYEKSANKTWSAEFQMKDSASDDSAYVELGRKTIGSMSEYNKNEYGGRSFFFYTNFTGSADIRIRFVSNELSSAWTELKNLSAYVNVKGTAIGTSTQFSNAVDGDWSTMVDENTCPWIGYDYGEAIRITRFRYFFRPDLAARSNGAMLQYASDRSFSDAVTFLTVDSSKVNLSRANEYAFDIPVSARCWRIVSGTQSDSRSSVGEFEIIPADVPYKPSFEIARDDITNFYPVIVWTIPNELSATRLTVERSTSAVGPFTVLTNVTELAGQSCVTDMTAKVGVSYYYRVTTDCNHPNFTGQTATSAVANYRRYRRLDRSWTDQTKLLDNCTILQPTNGTEVITKNAFDGDVSTWPDRSAAPLTDGPVGLNFGEKAWVAAFGYVCRNNNDCYSRIKNTQLFSSSGNDVGQSDKVVRSDYVQQASQSTAFYYQPTTSIPDDGAQCWFLFGTRRVYRTSTDSFCLNVAELAFFGWTQKDIDAAGVFVAANNLKIVRKANGTGVDVSWTAGINVMSYRLERRVRGAEAWTTAVDAIDAAATSCSDVYEGVAELDRQNVWEYRLVSIGEGETSATSETATHPYYLAGGGTGLSGSLYAPYKAGNAIYNCPVWITNLVDGAVNFNVPDGTELAAGSGVTADARLCWRGTIIVPMSGTYTFTLATTDGGAVHINGTSVCNSWVGGAKTSTGQIVLDVGEYPIEVDARLQYAQDNRRACVLSWAGPVPDEVVPASQLKPAASPIRLEHGGWNVRQYNGKRLGRAQSLEDGICLYGPQEGPASRNEFNATALTKSCHDSCDVSARMTSIDFGTAGVFARAGNGNLFGVYFKYDGSGNSFVGTYAITNGSDAVFEPVGKMKIDGSANQSVDIRLKYNAAKKKFYAYWKDDVATGDNPTEWALFGAFTYDELVVDEYEYGFFVTGGTSSYRSSFKINPIAVKVYRSGGMIVIIR